MTSPVRPAAAPTAAPPGAVAAGAPLHLGNHGRATMPPPGPATDGAGATGTVGVMGGMPRLRPTLTPPPVPRRVGARAEEAAMRARVEEARTVTDERAERDASVQLARWLAARERDLDQAVDLGRRALALREDPELRRELAAWLESLGDPAGASAMLASLAASLEGDGQQAARVQSRIGALEARAFRGLAVEINSFTLGFCGAHPDEVYAYMDSVGYEALTKASGSRQESFTGNEFFVPR